jgi:pilus assembly protein CpaB
MKTRLIAGAVAVVLAAVGTVVLVSYVRGADARAMEGLATVDVLVAAEPIPQGTTGTDTAALVESRQLPANAVLPGGVSNLDQLTGEVALVALEPGEQLLDSKFGAPPDADPDAVVVPPEMQEITVLLDLQRALGGQLEAGDTVGVFLSTKEPDDIGRTHLSAHKVLVTNVQRPTVNDADTAGSDAAGSDTATPASDTTGAPPPPEELTDSVLVTVATTAPIAEKVVFAATYGSVWLSNEPLTADENGTQVIDGTVVFK